MTFDSWLYLPYGKKKYKKNTLLHWLVISSIRTEIQREQKEDFFHLCKGEWGQVHFKEVVLLGPNIHTVSVEIPHSVYKIQEKNVAKNSEL